MASKHNQQHKSRLHKELTSLQPFAWDKRVSIAPPKGIFEPARTRSGTPSTPKYKPSRTGITSSDPDEPKTPSVPPLRLPDDTESTENKENEPLRQNTPLSARSGSKLATTCCYAGSHDTMTPEQAFDEPDPPAASTANPGTLDQPHTQQAQAQHVSANESQYIGRDALTKSAHDISPNQTLNKTRDQLQPPQEQGQHQDPPPSDELLGPCKHQAPLRSAPAERCGENANASARLPIALPETESKHQRKAKDPTLIRATQQSDSPYRKRSCNPASSILRKRSVNKPLSHKHAIGRDRSLCASPALMSTESQALPPDHVNGITSRLAAGMHYLAKLDANSSLDKPLWR